MIMTRKISLKITGAEPFPQLPSRLRWRYAAYGAGSSSHMPLSTATLSSVVRNGITACTTPLQFPRARQVLFGLFRRRFHEMVRRVVPAAKDLRSIMYAGQVTFGVQNLSFTLSFTGPPGMKGQPGQAGPVLRETVNCTHHSRTTGLVQIMCGAGDRFGLDVDNRSDQRDTAPPRTGPVSPRYLWSRLTRLKGQGGAGRQASRRLALVVADSAAWPAMRRLAMGLADTFLRQAMPRTTSMTRTLGGMSHLQHFLAVHKLANGARRFYSRDRIRWLTIKGRLPCRCFPARSKRIPDSSFACCRRASRTTPHFIRNTMKPLESAASKICLRAPLTRRKCRTGAGPTFPGISPVWDVILQIAHTGLKARAVSFHVLNAVKPPKIPALKSRLHFPPHPHRCRRGAGLSVFGRLCPASTPSSGHSGPKSRTTFLRYLDEANPTGKSGRESCPASRFHPLRPGVFHLPDQPHRHHLLSCSYPSWKTRKRPLDAGLRGRVRFNCTRRQCRTRYAQQTLPRPCLRVQDYGQTRHAIILRVSLVRILFLRSRAQAAGAETRITTTPIPRSGMAGRFPCLLRLRGAWKKRNRLFGAGLHISVLCLVWTVILHSGAQAGPETRTTTDLLRFIRALEAPRGYADYERRISLPPPKPLTAMSIGEVLDWQVRVRRSGAPSSAAGGYQIIHPTLKRLVTKYDIPRSRRFDAGLQDHLARLLIGECGRKGAKSNHPRYGNCLAGIWAALPLTQGVNRGRSAHHGVAGNKALTHPETLLALLAGQPVRLPSRSRAAPPPLDPAQTAEALRRIGQSVTQPLAFGARRITVEEINTAMRKARRDNTLTPSIRSWKRDPYAQR